MKHTLIIGLAALLLASYGHASKEPQGNRATTVVHGSEYHGEELIDSCNTGGWNDPPTGEIKFRVVKEGGIVKGKAIAYRITNASHTRNKANATLGLRVWDNSAGSGSGSLPGNVEVGDDNLIQDGNWHAVTEEIGKKMSFDVKRARFGTEFIFDMVGNDASCWAMNHEFVF